MISFCLRERTTIAYVRESTATCCVDSEALLAVRFRKCCHRMGFLAVKRLWASVGLWDHKAQKMRSNSLSLSLSSCPLSSPSSTHSFSFIQAHLLLSIPFPFVSLYFLFSLVALSLSLSLSLSLILSPLFSLIYSLFIFHTGTSITINSFPLCVSLLSPLIVALLIPTLIIFLT